MAVSTLSNLLVRTSDAGTSDTEQRPLDFALICRLWQYTRNYALRRNVLLVLVLVRAVQLPLLTGLLTAIIEGPIQRHDTIGVACGAALFGLLALSTQCVLHFRQRLAFELGESVVRDLRIALFTHLQTMPMSWFHGTRVGRVIARMSSDVEDVRLGVQDVLFVCLVQLGQMGIAALYMIWYDFGLFLLLLLVAPIIAFINRIFHRKLSESMRDMRESFTRVTATLVESVTGIRVTQAFVRQEENSRAFRELTEDHSRYNSAVARTQGLFVPLLELNGQLAVACLLLLGGLRALSPNSNTSVGELVGFFMMANLFFSPISVLGNQYHQAMTAMAGAERLFELLDTPPAWQDTANCTSLLEIRGDVEFHHVAFGYSPGRPVLRDISLSAKAGDSIAIVGETGSGKSSIINLLTKFYLPDSGVIRLDGHDLNAISSDSLHRHLGIVLQQNFLFQETIANNIRFGRPSASHAEIERALQQLDCVDMFSSLPAGLDTLVGEGGTNLSSGQRQLVCFARAMLADPRILVLDEATSSIDSLTEMRLQRALSNLVRGRTSFIVAHRLSTIRQATEILVLEHGQITERGSHDELLAHRGAYWRLHRRLTRSHSNFRRRELTAG